jgi:RHS repeat-associated protein
VARKLERQVTFNPGPYSAGNHVPGFSYDGDGNVTNDGSYTYTYDSEGRPTSISGTNAIYDAFNRLVEIQASGTNTQLLYSPDGFKFAYMNGQTVQKYIAPLTGGVQAVYTAVTPAPPAFWRHSDWLGTVRLDSTPAQTMYFDGAYAPFGEQYDGAGTSDRVFTGQTQDIVSARTDFLFRQYSSTQGRWIVPDPAGLAAARKELKNGGRFRLQDRFHVCLSKISKCLSGRELYFFHDFSPPMLISLKALLVTLSSIFRSRAALELENLALRHQIGVLQRSAKKRLRLTPMDRLLWVWLSRIWSD